MSETERLARRLAAAYYQHAISDEAWENLGRTSRERWTRVAVAALGRDRDGVVVVAKREWMIA